MEVITLTVIIIFICTTIYFAYRYFSLKQRAHLNQQLISGIKELSAGHVVEQLEGNNAQQMAFNQLIDFTGRVREDVQALSGKVRDKGEKLMEHGEYAAEKADIVRAAIDEVGKGLNKQLVATEESAVSLSDMTEAIEELSVRSNHISEQSNTTLELTQEGNNKLQDSMQKMAAFNQTINGTFHAIENLGEKSHEIGNIVKVITGISEQINLLALNAAIEAARAGEHGKGFAVVADEVRKLAEQSRQSSSEVAHIVKNIQEETERVVKSMEQGTEQFAQTNTIMLEVGSMFEQVVGTTKTIAENNANASASTEELSSSAQQIMVSMKEIEFISQESVEMFEELIEISDEELETMDSLVKEAQSLLTFKENQMLFKVQEDDQIKIA